MSHADTDIRTVADLIGWAEGTLAAAGVVCAHGTADYRDEAAAIIFHALGLEHADPGAYECMVAPFARNRVEALLQRRIAERIPAPYLLGEAWFAGLQFHVDQRVLIPRSPFAELIEAHFAPWLPTMSNPRILEIGTGSGCIAIACALAFPGSDVLATDVSSDALEVARINVERYRLQDRIRLRQADLFDGIEGRFHLIVTNPPYVPDRDLADMPAELSWEPRQALAGGPDGLALVRRILDHAPRCLEREGWLAIEVGSGMEALERAYPRLPFVWPDLERGGDGIALVAASELAVENDRTGHPRPT